LLSTGFHFLSKLANLFLWLTRTRKPSTRFKQNTVREGIPRKKPGLLRRITELVIQNKSLSAENQRLARQNELLNGEVGRYKEMMSWLKGQDQVNLYLHEKKNKDTRYKTATVLYADVSGFEDFAVSDSARRIVDRIDELFIQLQTISSKFEVKQIRTVGDSLMLVGGIPRKNITNPVEVVLAAVEMHFHIRMLRQAHPSEPGMRFRVGIHTGAVMAVTTGRKKAGFDVKGETVNLAARIRQFCNDDQILISATTYELVKDLFDCEFYRKMPVKYQGEIPLYSVKGIRPEFSLQGKGIIPNKRFSVRFALTQFTDLQEIILDKLEKELPRNLYYHNVKHTVDVVTQAELIGLGEGVTDEELLMLKTAALFHDTGHMASYDNHEYFSTLVAREILSEYTYTQSQIDTICSLILCTKLPPKPKSRLEAIMCDADLDYLGRSDMIPVSNSLYLELKERSMIRSLNEWNNLQMRFISGHQYFTDTARKLREVNKQSQISRIRDLLVED